MFDTEPLSDLQKTTFFQDFRATFDPKYRQKLDERLDRQFNATIYKRELKAWGYKDAQINRMLELKNPHFEEENPKGGKRLRPMILGIMALVMFGGGSLGVAAANASGETNGSFNAAAVVRGDKVISLGGASRLTEDSGQTIQEPLAVPTTTPQLEIQVNQGDDSGEGAESTNELDELEPPDEPNAWEDLYTFIGEAMGESSGHRERIYYQQRLREQYALELSASNSMRGTLLTSDERAQLQSYLEDFRAVVYRNKDSGALMSWDDYIANADQYSEQQQLKAISAFEDSLEYDNPDKFLTYENESARLFEGKIRAMSADELRNYLSDGFEKVYLSPLTPEAIDTLPRVFEIDSNSLASRSRAPQYGTIPPDILATVIGDHELGPLVRGGHNYGAFGYQTEVPHFTGGTHPGIDLMLNNPDVKHPDNTFITPANCTLLTVGRFGTEGNRGSVELGMGDTSVLLYLGSAAQHGRETGLYMMIGHIEELSPELRELIQAQVGNDWQKNQALHVPIPKGFPLAQIGAAGYSIDASGNPISLPHGHVEFFQTNQAEGGNPRLAPGIVYYKDDGVPMIMGGNHEGVGNHLLPWYDQGYSHVDPLLLFNQ